MAKAKSPYAGAYLAHRQRQRERILDSARELFDARGIDRVTMAEITAASGVQPSTLYKYFPNKDEIVAALVSEIFANDSLLIEQRVGSAPDALARIAALFDFFAEDLARSPRNARFMAQFDALYAREWPVEKLLAMEASSGLRDFHFLTRLIREGVADGSLRADLQPAFTLHAVLNAVIGLERRLAALGGKLETEFGQPIDRLFREALRILLLGMASPRAARRFRFAPPTPSIQQRHAGLSTPKPRSVPRSEFRPLKSSLPRAKPTSSRNAKVRAGANSPRKPHLPRSSARPQSASRTAGETR